METRKVLAKSFNKLGFKTGAEIGVRSGYYSKVLLRNIKNLHLICVDPWLAYESIEPVTQKESEAALKKCQKRLEGYDVRYMRMTSMEAIELIPDESLDFVYIDAIQDFDHIMVNIIHWAPKVRVNGIVSGRNYFPYFRNGVMHAVDAYTYAHNINWLITTDEKYPTYYWRKK